MNQKPLAPTLWRTCRVLACPRRLAVLAAVLERGPVCVKDVARISRMPENTATQYLRALQARGLLTANRQGRWVYYVAHPDPSVPHAEPMLAAMRKAILQDNRCESMTAALTAFTHPRRIAIVRRLNTGPGCVEMLAHDTGMSLPACYRHLDKLVRRTVVAIGADGNCMLARPAAGLATSLLQAALE